MAQSRKILLVFIGLIAMAVTLPSQEYRMNPMTGRLDLVASNQWKTVGAGVLASRPATCTANKDVYVCNGTGCTAGQNIHYCTATNTWTAQGAAGGITSLGGQTGATQTITRGAGIGGSSATNDHSFTTASGEADFLASGALVCGAATQGKAQVHTTPLQYCDNAATPALRYAGYGDSSGNALFPSLTLGSIPFLGSNGAVLQDNSNLFWDDTNNTAGFGTTRTGAISATNPLLRIKGTSTAATTSSFEVQDSIAGTKFIVLDDGKVGIGTAGPATLLEIKGAQGARPTFEITNGSGAGSGWGEDSLGTIDFFQQDQGTPDGTGGKVGTRLQTTAKDAAGNSRFDIFQNIDNGDSMPATPAFVINTSNIGIGTTTPDFPLQVNGIIAPETTAQDLGTTALRWDFFGATLDTTTIQNATISGGLATTSHAANSNFISSLRHATDCTAIADGVAGELCWEADANTIYACEPSAGGCDTVGEWTKITDNDSGGTPAWNALINSADAATSYLSNNTAETVTFSFESAFGASQQFLVRQQTGNPTAGTLLDVRAADAQVTVFRAGDGTNGITVSQTGALTAEGTGSVAATNLQAASSVVSNAEVDDDLTLTNITQITTRSHTSLSDIGTNNHAAIDSHISGTAEHGATGAVMGTTNTQSPTNKTLDGGTATTTHAAGANFLEVVRHATDCTAIVDGLSGELCVELDSERLFSCQPTAGGCDTPGEWILTGDGAGGGNSFGTIGAAVADAGADTLTTTDSLSIDLQTTDNPEDLSAILRYDLTLVGDPALAVSTLVPTDDCPGAGFLSEGSIANTNEQLWCFPSNDGVDTTNYIASGASDGDALAGDSATSFFDAGAIEAARGGTADDTSGTTGVPRITTGNWTYDAGISHLATSTSATLAGVLSDETGGTSKAVFDTNPTLIGATINGGDLALSDGVGDSPKATFTPQTGTAFSAFVADSDDDMRIEAATASEEQLEIINTSTGILTVLIETTDGVLTDLKDGAHITEGTIDEARLDANVVLDNAANSYSTGAQDFTSATSLTVPVAAGAGPTANGQVAYDSTANQLEYGEATVNRIVVNTNEAQTLTTKTIDGNSNILTVIAGQYAAASIDGDDLLGSSVGGVGLTLTAGAPDTLDCDAASTTAVGCPEMAIASEVDTGTDATRAITPDALAGSYAGTKVVEAIIFKTTDAVTIGDNKVLYKISPSLYGMTLISVGAGVNVVSSSGAVTVDLARCLAVATGNACSGTVQDLLSTNITIDANEDDTELAAAAAVLANNTNFVAGEWVRFDVDGAGTGVQGLVVWLEFRLP